MLNFKTHGQPIEGKPPVIVLHGFLGDLSNWQSVCHALSNEHFLIALDAPNHGQSPWQAECDYTSQASALLEFMDAQEITIANIIGHSMGGKTAIKLAETSPSRINKLVVVDIAPRTSIPSRPTIVDKLISADISDAPSRITLQARLEAAGIKTKVVQFFLKSYTPHHGWKFNLKQLHLKQKDIYAAVWPKESINIESRFIQGMKSSYITNKDIENIQDVFNKVSFDAFYSGHWPHIEKRNQMIESLKSFL